MADLRTNGAPAGLYQRGQVFIVDTAVDDDTPAGALRAVRALGIDGRWQVRIEFKGR